MSLHLTIYSNALHQTDYRPTPPAFLSHKLLHRLLYQFSRSQCRPNHAANEFTLHLRVPTPYKQPMSLFLMTPHVTERMSNALLCCRPRSPHAPKSSTYQSVLSLRHNPTNHCAPTNSTYQSVLSPMAQPQKPRVLFDVVNEPTIRCPLCVDITHYPTSIQYSPTYPMSSSPPVRQDLH
jgi:hypothetical protein